MCIVRKGEYSTCTEPLGLYEYSWEQKYYITKNNGLETTSSINYGYRADGGRGLNGNMRYKIYKYKVRGFDWDFETYEEAYKYMLEKCDCM